MAGAIPFRFDHVHYYCSDLAASERWFVEGLGGEVTQRMESGGAKSVFLRLGEASVILRSSPEGENLAAGDANRYGTHHLGLIVDDLDATAAELKRRGVRFIMEPNEIRPGVKISFISGPDDVQIEVLERRR